MTRRIFTLPILLLIATTGSLASATANAGSFSRSMAGTWETFGTPDPGQCGPTASFTNLTTITRDGTVVNVDPEVGTAVGNTYRIKKNRFAAGFFGFISPAPGITLKYEVQATAKLLNHGEFTGKFRTTIVDMAGVIPDCTYEGVISGHRLVVMPY